MADHLHNHHHNIWANMNHLPMHCDVFEHIIDDKGITEHLINDFGMVPMDDMCLTDHFTHEMHIKAVTMCIVAFLKDDFGKGL